MSIKQRLKRLESQTGNDFTVVIPSVEFLPLEADFTHAVLTWEGEDPRRVDRQKDESLQSFKDRLDLICAEAVQKAHGAKGLAVGIEDAML